MQAHQLPAKKKLTIYINDFDNCFAGGKDAKDVQKLLESKKAIYDLIVAHIIASGCSEALFINGSNRQTKGVDDTNIKAKETCSVFPYLEAVPAFVNTILKEQQSNVSARLEKMLLLDIVHDRRLGESFDMIQRGEKAGNCIFDSQKFILLFAFFHALAKKYEDYELDVRFLDDRYSDICKPLETIFKAFPDLIPPNFASLEIITHEHSSKTLNATTVLKPGKRSVINTHIKESIQFFLSETGNNPNLQYGQVEWLIRQLMVNDGAIIKKFISLQAIWEFEKDYPVEIKAYSALQEKYKHDYKLYLRGEIDFTALTQSQNAIRDLQNNLESTAKFGEVQQIPALDMQANLNDMTIYLNFKPETEVYSALQSMLKITSNWGKSDLSNEVSELKNKLNNPHLIAAIESIAADQPAISKQYQFWQKVVAEYDLFSAYKTKSALIRTQLNGNLKEIVLNNLDNFQTAWKELDELHQRLPSEITDHTNLHDQLETDIGVKLFPWCEKYHALKNCCDTNDIATLAKLVNDFETTKTSDNPDAAYYLNKASIAFLEDKAREAFSTFFNASQFKNKSAEKIQQQLLKKDNPLHAFPWKDQLEAIERFSVSIPRDDSQFHALRLYYIDKIFEIAAKLIEKNDPTELAQFKKYVASKIFKPFFTTHRKDNLIQTKTETVSALEELEKTFDERIAKQTKLATKNGEYSNTIFNVFKEWRCDTAVKKIAFIQKNREDLKALSPQEVLKFFSPIIAIGDVHFNPQGDVKLKITYRGRLNKAVIKLLMHELADNGFDVKMTDIPQSMFNLFSNPECVIKFSPVNNCPKENYSKLFDQLLVLTYINSKEHAELNQEVSKHFAPSAQSMLIQQPQ